MSWQVEADDRPLRVCDECGGIDKHPRHTVDAPAGTHTPDAEIVRKVLASKEFDQDVIDAAYQSLMDTTSLMRHIDCCAHSSTEWRDADGNLVATGCPKVGTPEGCDGRAEKANGKTGQGMLSTIEKHFPPTAPDDEPAPGSPVAAASALATFLFMHLPLLFAAVLLRVMFLTTGLAGTTLANKWLDMLGGTAFTAPTGTWLKLHTADPGAAGATAASANTTRVQCTWNAASAGSKSISNTPTWASWASGTETETHVSGWDASTAGNFLLSGALASSKTVTNGDTFTVSSLTVSLAPIAA